MTKRLLLLFFVFTSASVNAKIDSLAGTWQARLKFMKFDVRIVFRFEQKPDSTWTGTAQSPDQSKMISEIDEVLIEGDSITLGISEWDASFNGRFNPDSNAIIGKMTQRGFKLPLKLLKGEEDDLLYDRPQKPRPPFNYKSEEVHIVNKSDGDTLAGTLTIPNGKGPFPVAVLITGSGLQDRDESIFGHKPFLLIADRLTRSGIAVLRCDDRGAGKSTGNSSDVTLKSMANDVSAQLEFLRKRKDMDKRRMGLIGHSEGGIIAPLVASDDKKMAFMILLAGPSIDFFDLLLAQDSISLKAEGRSKKEIDKLIKTNTGLFEIMRTATDSLTTQQRIVEYMESIQATDAEMELAIRQLCTPLMRSYIGHDPAAILKKVTCPILALYGEKDVQVPPSINTPVLESIFSTPEKSDCEINVLPGLNHLFQPCKKGAVSEYVDIPITMDPSALSAMETWLARQFSTKK
ncbi:MAG: alpha/beta hydrolase family protein [Bacteroidota bacterium]